MSGDHNHGEFTWLERSHYDNAELDFHINLLRGCDESKVEFCPKSHAKICVGHEKHETTTIAGQIAKAREEISHTLKDGTIASSNPTIDELIKTNKHLLERIDKLENLFAKLTSTVQSLQTVINCKTSDQSTTKTQQATIVQVPVLNGHATPKKQTDDAEEDDFELFGSDEEVVDEEADRVKQERLKAYEAKKSKKPQLIAKSNIILDVKPWDDETDMKKLEECVRSIHMDGLLWGASKLVPVGYGIKKLQISCVVEDDKVSTEELEEKITEFEDYIQSTDIAAFNKI